MSSRARALAIGLAIAAPTIGVAQGGAERHGTTRLLFVNDEWERYARVMQIAGDVGLYPWSVREFTARESDSLDVVDSTRVHPWSAQPTPREREWRGLKSHAVDGELAVIYNTAFPFGYNDGQLWAGRGLTTAARAGIAVHRGAVHAVVAPRLTRAENLSFGMHPNGLAGLLAYAHPFYPASIDQPQRFGGSAYQQITLDNTRLELDALGAVAGFSTATQHWGPARDHPLLLGNNAAGFPHALLGSSTPINVGIGRVHARMMWGRLDASEYTGMRQIERYRFASGIVAVLQPKFAPGLEVGYSRFFHQQWHGGVINLANVLRPFIGIVRDSRIDESGNPIGDEPDNQLASAFARWVFPRSGFEVYGEFAKEDYNKDARDLTLEPDHISGYMIGLQRVVKRLQPAYFVFRAEILNTRLSPLALNRPQTPFYIHSPLGQGHTHAGQVLGSAAAYGGGASVLGVDRYTSAGRTTLSWSRLMRAEYRPSPNAMPEPGRADLFHAITIDGIVFRKRLALTYELTSVYEINRHFAGDAFNLRMATGARVTW
ncbi:MAG TPA: capsule assembly Wzi family protein [Gemmatimonadaceae bacterium]|nr:capsule assembly Wzi family protein [Gemmatimonadaceae bacterium]